LNYTRFRGVLALSQLRQPMAELFYYPDH